MSRVAQKIMELSNEIQKQHRSAKLVGVSIDIFAEMSLYNSFQEEEIIKGSTPIELYPGTRRIKSVFGIPIMIVPTYYKTNRKVAENVSQSR